MASYIIRKIDDELWRKVKVKAAKDDITVKDTVEWLFRSLTDPDSSVSRAYGRMVAERKQKAAIRAEVEP